KGRVRLKAGRRLYADSPGRIFAVDLAAAGADKPQVAWSAEMKETVGDMLAADGKLFVVTKEGGIHCFGPEKVEPETLETTREPLPVVEDDWTKRTAHVLRQTDPVPGYVVALGIDSGRLIEELIRQSDLHVIGVDRDAAKINRLRRKLDAAGLYGERVSLHVGDPASFDLPPYFARLVVVGESAAAGPAFVKRVFDSLRPYGGSACFVTSAEGHAALAKDVEGARLPGAEVRRTGDLTVLVRVGPLEGAGKWTHDNADAGRQTRSTDRVVKAPLGVLWFGGEAGGDIFRQGNYPAGPSPLVIDGRMILQGIHSLYAVDVYSGRILWKTPLAPPDNPASPTRDIGYLAGNARSFCYTQTLASDAFYIGWGGMCRVFDPATGKEIAAWKMPTDEANARWGNLLLVDDVLVSASCTPVDLQKLPVDEEKLSVHDLVRLTEWVDALQRIRALPTPAASKAAEGLDEQLGKLLGPQPLAEKFARYKTHAIAASMEFAERILAVDRKSGKLLWTYECTYGCQHNSALVAGGGKVFLVDAFPKATAALLQKRGKLPEDYAPKLVALDLKTGSLVWSTTEDVWGVGGLSYAPRHDLILQAGGTASRYRVTRKAEDGSLLWKKRMHCEAYGWYHPSIITDDVIMSYLGDVYDLKTGERKRIAHPLTGEEVPWTLFTRSHGCNHAVASENLVTLRVGNAAYVDLVNFSGTHSLGGFRSGCQNSLIVADGVLCAPRYSRCACSYPIFTSLGLVHSPDLEQWSFFGRVPVRDRVKRVGLNLGAPGDRRDERGTLWLDCPSVGGPSPDIPVKLTPENAERFCHRSSRVEGGGLRWVAASGFKGLSEVTVTLAPEADDEQTYSVRLHFCEPDPVGPGRRLFSVAIQGEKVLEDLDVVREAGGPDRTLVREFKGVKVKNDLTITLSPSEGAEVPAPVLSGIEIIAE
ncbi:MAG TPA: malectin domain-containing carbohydrate-binding protein, partial [Planctomycetota bacterium]|nr:malectin domain-containing carbohydrate-binding protein [Planctomycetota bacterium]